MPRNVLYGQTANGTYVPVKVDADGYTQITESRSDHNAIRKVWQYDANFGVNGIVIPGINSSYFENKVRLIGETPGSTILDTEFWDSTVAGSGTNTQVGGEVVIATGTTANSSAILRTKTAARYLTGGVNVFLVGFRVPDTGTTNNTRRWGAFDANNGFFFELAGTTLSAVCRKSGVDTKVASTSWTTAFTLDTVYHRYEIYWFGASAIFVIDGVVRLSLSGNITTTRSATMSLKISYENVNSGGSTTSTNMYVRGSSIARFGPETSRPRFKNIAAQGTTILKYIPGTLHRIIINRSGSNNSTITIYDNSAASGTLIATVNTSGAQGTLDYGVDFSNGLTIVASATPGDITVVFD